MRRRRHKLALTGIVGEFIASKTSPCTRESYTRWLERFGDFYGKPPNQAMDELLAMDQGAAFRAVMRYRSDMVERDRSSGTVNAMVSVLTSLFRYARRAGVTTVLIEVDPLPVSVLRDCRGPSREAIDKLLGTIQTQKRKDNPQAHRARDLAYFEMCYTMGLRKNEALALDLRHVDLVAGTVSIRGKGRRDRIVLTVPPPTLQTLRHWLELRRAIVKSDAGTEAVFCNLHEHRRLGQRLSMHAVAAMFLNLSKVSGIRVRPHGLRHSGITRTLALNNGNLRATQRFSRHRNLNHVLVYDDARNDIGGSMSRLLAEDLAQPVTT